MKTLRTTTVLMTLLTLFLAAGAARGAVFAKYDGVDGESKDANHDKWIDVLSIDWGAHQPAEQPTGQSRRRGGAVVEDLILTIEYEKASPRLQEMALNGEIIPKLQIEQTANFGGARATYLKYELTNVMITSYQVNASGNDEAGPPTVVIGNNFEEIKVTYTEASARPNVDRNAFVGDDLNERPKARAMKNRRTNRGR